MSALSDIVAKFRKASPNIGAAFDEVERRLTALEQPTIPPPPTGSWPPVDVTPAPFTAVRTIQAATRAQFDSAYLGARDGDRILASGFEFGGQANFNRRFTGQGIEIVFAEGLRFTGSPTRDLNAAYVTGTRHRLFGGVLSNPLGHGILFHSSSDILWHGFRVDGVGGTCLRVFATGGDVTNVDLFGEVTRCGGDLTLDPHAEKGTGLHPSYIGGVATFPSSFAVRDSRFVIDAHDCPTGSNQIGPAAIDCEFYYRARNLTFQARSQTAANAVQLFGGQTNGRHKVWVEADNVAQVSRVSAESFLPITFVHGRGVNVRGNWDSQAKYMPNPAVTYQDCT